MKTNPIKPNLFLATCLMMSACNDPNSAPSVDQTAKANTPVSLEVPTPHPSLLPLSPSPEDLETDLIDPKSLLPEGVISVVDPLVCKHECGFLYHCRPNDSLITPDTTEMDPTLGYHHTITPVIIGDCRTIIPLRVTIKINGNERNQVELNPLLNEEITLPPSLITELKIEDRRKESLKNSSYYESDCRVGLIVKINQIPAEAK